MQLPDDLEPSLVWKHFKALSAIPRLSGQEAAAAAYVRDQALRLGCTVKVDTAGNVLVQKVANRADAEAKTVILQCHLDMVGQKTADSSHDFSKDPLQLQFDGNWVRATGTTLGADNGLGAATALALLEDEKLPHPPLAALFTVEEEIGLRGAAKVTQDFLPGDFLINLDGGDPCEITIGCAGAADLRAELSCFRTATKSDWVGLHLQVGGLLGGHSGNDIHLGRGNAIQLLARVLASLEPQCTWGLAQLEGGDARNAIPRDAKAILAVAPSQLEAFRAQIQRCSEELCSEYAATEPGLSIVMSEAEAPSLLGEPLTVHRYLQLLRSCPTGALRFVDAAAGVVETSNNLGIARLGASGPAIFQCLVRSLVDSAKMAVVSSLQGLVSLAGGRSELHGNYPGWKPAQASTLLQLYKTCAMDVLGQAPRISIVHGGLECGILKAAKPGLECLSVGALIENMHAPDERLQANSVVTFHKLLSQVLEKLASKAP